MAYQHRNNENIGVKTSSCGISVSTAKTMA
jgi:hypothetical protein